jgi:hypothetical protein
LAAIAAGAGRGQAQEDVRSALLADYRSHGLPLPPADAVLSLCEYGWRYSGGKQETSYSLIFVEKPRDDQLPVYWWYGCARIPFRTKDPPLQDAPPTVENADRSEPVDPYGVPIAFATHPDLALAIQCQARGWGALAGRLLARAHRNPRSSVRGPEESWPANDRKALALLAWNYWCNRFVEVDADQREVLGRLQRLLAGPYGLDTKARRTIVADMEKTLEKSTARADSLEAAIDRLRDLDFSGSS